MNKLLRETGLWTLAITLALGSMLGGTILIAVAIACVIGVVLQWISR